MYAYIKDWKLVYTSDTIHQKRQEESENIPFVDGLVYDEVIETELEGRVCYENGEIIDWEDSEEKISEETKALELAELEAEEYRKLRPEKIIEELGKLKTERDGLELLGLDTLEIDSRIQALKDEYRIL